MTPRIALLLITALGAALRFYHLDAQSIWYDESFSIAQSVRPLPQLFAALLHDRVHPPLHYLLLHFWFPLAGYSPASARALSALLGTLSIPALYLLARRFAPPSASLCAAFLLAISQIAVYFSQEARPYILVQLLSLLAALAFLSFLEKPSLRHAALFGTAALAVLYTHYYGASSLLALGLYWLLFRTHYHPKVFPRLAAIAALLLALFLPWVITAFRVSDKPHVVHQPPPLSAPLQAINRLNNTKLASFEDPTPLPLAAAAFVLFTLPALLALRSPGRPETRAAALGWLLTILPVSAALLGGALGMVFNYRHFSFTAPAYALAVAMGFAITLPSPALRTAWLAAAALLSSLALIASFTIPSKTDYRAAFLPISRAYAPGDCVTARPDVWQHQVHFAWQALHPDQPLQLVPFSDPPAPPPTCARLWIFLDKTPFLRHTPIESDLLQRALIALQRDFTPSARFPHPVLDAHLLLRRLPPTPPATTSPDPSSPPASPAPRTPPSR